MLGLASGASRVWSFLPYVFPSRPHPRRGQGHPDEVADAEGAPPGRGPADDRVRARRGRGHGPRDVHGGRRPRRRGREPGAGAACPDLAVPAPGAAAWNRRTRCCRRSRCCAASRARCCCSRATCPCCVPRRCSALLAAHHEAGAAVTVLTAVVDDPPATAGSSARAGDCADRRGPRRDARRARDPRDQRRHLRLRPRAAVPRSRRASARQTRRASTT